MTPDPEHEAKCRRCGRCCYEKFVVDDCVFTTRRPCPWLDVKTRLCSAYENRFDVNPRCLDIAEGITFGVFPAACPYVQNLPGYRPSEEGWLDEQTTREIERGTLTSAKEVAAKIRRRERTRGKRSG